MIVTQDTARYVLAVAEALDSGRLSGESATDVCPECGFDVSLDNEGPHVVMRNAGRLVVIVGCEGFWVVDPNLVGIDAPNWQPPDPDMR